MTTYPVRLLGTGSFLPGPPITNERLDEVLGPLDRAPAKVQSFVTSMGKRMLDRGGIRARHLAIDPENGNLTHSFSSLAEEAARNALEMAELEPNDIDLLIISCPSYDYSTPPTSTILQEKLGIQGCAEMEIHSNCSGVGKGMQVAYDALMRGRYQTALVCYSQLSSVYLRSCYFNQEQMSKTHAALRWILADGAGAVVLGRAQNGTAGNGIVGRVEAMVDGVLGNHGIIDTFVESVGARRPPGMTAGGGVADMLKADHQIPEMYAEGSHHLWQDFSAVNDFAAPLLLDGIVRMTERLHLDPATVDHYIISIPTYKLYEEHIPAYLDRLGVGRDQIKFRSADVGYVGGATILVHLDQMVRSGEILPGQIVIAHSVESSKWMTAGFAMRW